MMIVAKKAYTEAPSSTCQLEWRHDARSHGLTRPCGQMAAQMACSVRWRWCNAAASRGALVNERIISGGVDKTFEGVALSKLRPPCLSGRGVNRWCTWGVVDSCLRRL